MPTWMKCLKCKELFYTAKSEFYSPVKNRRITDEEQCSRCEGQLKKAVKDVDKVLKEGLILELSLQAPDTDSRARGKINNLHDEQLDIGLIDGNFKAARSNSPAGVEVRYSRGKPRPGRYKFESEIVDFLKTDESDIILKKPDHIVHRQERKALRLPLNAEVECKLPDRNRKLKGESVDLSLSGILIAAEETLNFEIDEPVEVELSVKNRELSIEGKIARITRFSERSHRGIGIEFESLDQKTHSVLKEFKLEKLRDFDFADN